MLNDSDARNNSFDLIRFLGALAVLYSHNFATTGLSQPKYFAGETAGSLGVFVFFAVSGYLVQQSWNRRPDKISFILSRVLRIFPALIVCLFLCAFILGPMVSSISLMPYLYRFETYRFIYSNVAMLFVPRYDALPGVFVDNIFRNHINSSLWTIRYEVFMYGALLLLCILFKRRRAILLAVTLLSLCAIWIFGRIIGLPEPGELLWRIGFLGLDGRILKLAPFFIMGALIAYLPKKHLSVRGGLLAIAFSTLFYYSENGIIVLWFALPYFIVAFSYNSPEILNRFGKYGDFSYGMYLYAFPVQQLLAHLAISTKNWWLGLFLTFFITLMLSILSWKFIEAPFLKLRKKLITPQVVLGRDL